MSSRATTSRAGEGDLVADEQRRGVVRGVEVEILGELEVGSDRAGRGVVARRAGAEVSGEQEHVVGVRDRGDGGADSAVVVRTWGGGAARGLAGRGVDGFDEGVALGRVVHDHEAIAGDGERAAGRCEGAPPAPLRRINVEGLDLAVGGLHDHGSLVLGEAGPAPAGDDVAQLGLPLDRSQVVDEQESVTDHDGGCCADLDRAHIGRVLADRLRAKHLLGASRAEDDLADVAVVVAAVRLLHERGDPGLPVDLRGRGDVEDVEDDDGAGRAGAVVARRVGHEGDQRDDERHEHDRDHEEHDDEADDPALDAATRLLQVDGGGGWVEGDTRFPDAGDAEVGVVVRGWGQFRRPVPTSAGQAGDVALPVGRGEHRAARVAS
jgi:hypothetical protein